MDGILPQNDGLQIFNYEDYEVRTVFIDGEPWWVALDVCEVLGVDRTQTRRLDDDEKGVCTVHTLGGNQQMAVVNESGLYSLILTSRKPKAKAFKRWITHEVIPAIRKTGSYTSPTQPVVTPHKLTDLLADRAKINTDRVPDHYFGVLSVLFLHLYNLERWVSDLDAKATLEISVGKHWRKYALDVLHIPSHETMQYRHILANGNEVLAWAYSHKWLTNFEKWLWNIYFTENFPGYVEYRKDKLALPAPKTQRQIKGGKS